MLRWIRLAPLVLATLGACSSDAVSRDGAAPPNIVFIMADDHAVRAVSAYGDPLGDIAPTPNIDRIAAGGMRFDESFVTNSLCGPSRAAMLTGKFGHKNGFRRNGDSFDGSQPTWPRLLKEAGYQTAVVGKWHINHTPEGIDFDYWRIFDDQGQYYNPDIVTKDGMHTVEGYATDLVTEFALDWLENRRKPDRPFLLMVQHKAPHRNWMPALRHTQVFETTHFPVPDNYFDDYAGRRAAAEQEMNVYRDMYEGHDLKMTTAAGSTELRYDRWPEHFARMTEEQRAAWDAAYQERNDAMNSADFDDREMALWKYQRYLKDYLRCIKSVDESVGTIRQTLEELGLVVEPDTRRRGLPVHEEIGLPACAVSGERIFELELGAGLVTGAVRAGEPAGQARTETRPQDRDDDVGLRRANQLLLEVPGGDQRLVLPENGVEHHPAGILALQALDDALCNRPFLEDIPGRRDEYAQLAHRTAGSLFASF